MSDHNESVARVNRLLATDSQYQVDYLMVQHAQRTLELTEIEYGVVYERYMKPIVEKRVANLDDLYEKLSKLLQVDREHILVKAWDCPASPVSTCVYISDTDPRLTECVFCRNHTRNCYRRTS